MADLDTIVSLSKRRGFLFPSSEIYGGLGAVYDYGLLGVELKRNVRERWWNAMVRDHENVVGLDAAILMHPTVWKASGHVDAFSDPLIDDRASGRRYRADQLIEGAIALKTNSRSSLFKIPTVASACALLLLEPLSTASISPLISKAENSIVLSEG